MLNSEQYFGVPTSGVSRTVALQRDWAVRLSKDPNDTTVRPVDRKADSAWRDLHIALQGAATLENTPRGESEL